MAHSIEEVLKARKTIIWIGVVLLACTGLTYLVSLPQFEAESRATNMTIGLAIATFKALLVGLIFMHLKDERGIIYKFLLFSVVFFCAMMFLFVLGFQDGLWGLNRLFDSAAH
jgi:caa(3)-type oxidase subunit IV